MGKFSFLTNPFNFGAEDWTRTSTRLPAQEPESCVSTNSTTSAQVNIFFNTEFALLQEKNCHCASQVKCHNHNKFESLSMYSSAGD